MIVKDTFQIYGSKNSKLIKIKLSRLIGLFSIFLLHLLCGPESEQPSSHRIQIFKNYIFLNLDYIPLEIDKTIKLQMSK